MNKAILAGIILATIAVTGYFVYPLVTIDSDDPKTQTKINNEQQNNFDSEIAEINVFDEHGGFKATILGSGGPIFNSERNGPSVLISNGEQKILVDMGNGTQSQLNSINVNIKTITGFFITHHHLDHNEELTPIFIKSLINGNRFTITGPTGTQNYISTIEDLYTEDIAYRLDKTKRTREDLKENYNIIDISGNESFSLAGMEISTTPVIHTIDTIAYRFDVNDKSIIVSGDLTYSEALSELAKDADILIIDSGIVIKTDEIKRDTNTQKTNSDAKNRAHATLEEIAIMAKDANVKTLVLTHFPPDEVDEAATREELAEYFLGEVIFAQDLMELNP